MAQRPSRTDETIETGALLESAFALARSLDIRTLMVQAHHRRDRRVVERFRERERIIWVARSQRSLRLSGDPGDAVITMPGTALARASQLNLTVFLAALNRHIEPDEQILVLYGLAGRDRLDTLVIVKPSRDYPWLAHHRPAAAMTRHIARLLEIALRLAREGREGTPIGTIFVLGDPPRLESYLRQLILNPLQGHAQRSRSIHQPELLETLRELAALDGAFIVNSRGIVESAGTYVDAPLKKSRLAPGLGARHAAALAITSATDATAVVVSASSGTVSVYDAGTIVLELERSHQ